jgi:hypothetical protein
VVVVLVVVAGPDDDPVEVGVVTVVCLIVAKAKLTNMCDGCVLCA